MNIESITTLVHTDLLAVNDLILSTIQTPGGLIDQLASHLMQSGGKRLRPLIVLLSAHACAYSGRDHIKLAAMMELFHTATLLHDDVVDESILRRGKETAHEIWGSKASILVGDYLLTQYMRYMHEVGCQPIIESLTDIAVQITQGEIAQLMNRHNAALSLEAYFDVIRSKTSLLFAGSAHIGALIASVDEYSAQCLYTYGLHLGNAFQLIDDVMDYDSHASIIGKNTGDDLADGKVTLPLMYALQHGTPAQKAIIQETLQQGRRENFPQILSVIHDTKAIEYTQDMAHREVQNAIEQLQGIPDSDYKQALINVAFYALLRTH